MFLKNIESKLKKLDDFFIKNYEVSHKELKINRTPGKESIIVILRYMEINIYDLIKIGRIFSTLNVNIDVEHFYEEWCDTHGPEMWEEFTITIEPDNGEFERVSSKGFY